MKLYFYHLSQPLREKPRIEVEECEVEEKPKTYKPVEEFPRFYCGCYVMKREIGKLDGNTVVLTKKDSAKAAEVFKEEFYGDIKRNQNRIEEIKKEVAKAYDLIDMVDDWRLENETH